MEITTWVTEHWQELLGILAFGVLVFDRIAKLTPTESDNRLVKILYRVCAVLGVKVPDNEGKTTS